MHGWATSGWRSRIFHGVWRCPGSAGRGILRSRLICGAYINNATANPTAVGMGGQPAAGAGRFTMASGLAAAIPPLGILDAQGGWSWRSLFFYWTWVRCHIYVFE